MENGTLDTGLYTGNAPCEEGRDYGDVAEVRGDQGRPGSHWTDRREGMGSFFLIHLGLVLGARSCGPSPSKPVL